MKKILLFSGFLIIIIFCGQNPAVASGIQGEGLGAKALSMGGAFIALADDSSAIYWNPAGLARLKGSRIELGIYSMNSKLWDRTSVSNLYPGKQNPVKGDLFTKVYPSEPSRFHDETEFWPSCATMPSILAYKSYKGYTIGGGLYVNAGVYSKWDDKIKDPLTNADISAAWWSNMAIVTANGSIARQITEKLSVGIGLDLMYARLKGDADKNYKNSQKFLRPDYEFRLGTESDGMGLQGVLGLLYTFSPRLSIGGMIKSGTTFDLNGETSIRQTFMKPNGEPIEALNFEEKSYHKHRFTYPMVWGLGIAYKPIPSLTLTFDWQRADWTNFMWPIAKMDFKDEGILLRDINGNTDWSASDAFRFGMEYQYNDRLALRAGYFAEESGIPSDGEGITTTVCGYVKFVNAGFGYKWKKWNFDFMGGTMWGETPGGTGHQ